MLVKSRATMGSVVFALAMGCAASASAQLSATANGPYYATPSWDQRITTGRFVVLANWNNEAVLDRETGLVWYRAIASANTLPGASEHCAFSARGGRLGWRLPTLPEVLSLTEPDGGASFLPAGHPFDGVPAVPFLPSSVSLFTATRTLVSPFAGAAYWTVGWGRAPLPQGTVVTVRGQSALENPFSPNYFFCVRGGLFEGSM